MKQTATLGSDYAKENSRESRRLSNSRERIRRDSTEYVAYDRNNGDGDEVSIGYEWWAGLVSIGTAHRPGTIPTRCQSVL